MMQTSTSLQSCTIHVKVYNQYVMRLSRWVELLLFDQTLVDIFRLTEIIQVYPEIVLE